MKVKYDKVLDVLREDDLGSVFRNVVVSITPGATPGTNINISKQDAAGYGTYNAPSITNATNLAKDATSGSFSLNATGKQITLDITETIIAPISVSINRGKWNTAEQLPYYIFPYVSDGNLSFKLYKVGGSSGNEIDWTTVLDASDQIYFTFSFITAT